MADKGPGLKRESARSEISSHLIFAIWIWRMISWGQSVNVAYVA